MTPTLLSAAIIIYALTWIDWAPVYGAGTIGKAIWNCVVCGLALVIILTVWVAYLAVMLAAS